MVRIIFCGKSVAMLLHPLSPASHTKVESIISWVVVARLFTSRVIKYHTDSSDQGTFGSSSKGGKNSWRSRVVTWIDETPLYLACHFVDQETHLGLCAPKREEYENQQCKFVIHQSFEKLSTQIIPIMSQEKHNQLKQGTFSIASHLKKEAPKCRRVMIWSRCVLAIATQPTSSTYLCISVLLGQ
jgi:hypothetical protein